MSQYCKYCGSQINPNKEICNRCVFKITIDPQKFFIQYGFGYTKVNWKQQQDNKMPSGNCEFVYDPTLDVYRLTFDYQGWNKQHKTFLDVLKRVIVPSSDREYNPVTHAWLISAQNKQGKDYFDLIAPLLDVTFYPVFKFSKQEASKYTYSSSQTGPQISASEYINRFNKIVVEIGLETLTDNTDLPTATKIYRRAAMLLHPDKNPGNEEVAEKMSILNEAWTSIKTEKMKKEQILI
jgi:DnaJ domain